MLLRAIDARRGDERIYTPTDEWCIVTDAQRGPASFVVAQSMQGSVDSELQSVSNPQGSSRWARPRRDLTTAVGVQHDDGKVRPLGTRPDYGFSAVKDARVTLRDGILFSTNPPHSRGLVFTFQLMHKFPAPTSKAPGGTSTPSKRRAADPLHLRAAVVPGLYTSPKPIVSAARSRLEDPVTFANPTPIANRPVHRGLVHVREPDSTELGRISAQLAGPGKKPQGGAPSLFPPSRPTDQGEPPPSVFR
jgi:hypothetical protein